MIFTSGCGHARKPRTGAGLRRVLMWAPAAALVFVNPITDICWSCLFPISVGGPKIWSSSRPDPSNPTSLPLCLGSAPGHRHGFWEPVRLADVSMKPRRLRQSGRDEARSGLRY